MEYQILDIQPGSGQNDLIVTVGIWYNDFARGLGRKPDYTEDHAIFDFPADFPGFPVMVHGGYLLEDGTIVNPFIEVDGEWVEGPIPDNVQREPVLPLVERLLEPIERRIAEIGELPDMPMPEDRFPLGAVRRVAEKKKKDHLLDRKEVKALKGRTKKMQRHRRA